MDCIELSFCCVTLNPECIGHVCVCYQKGAWFIFTTHFCVHLRTILFMKVFLIFFIKNKWKIKQSQLFHVALVIFWNSSYRPCTDLQQPLTDLQCRISLNTYGKFDTATNVWHWYCYTNLNVHRMAVILVAGKLLIPAYFHGRFQFWESYCWIRWIGLIRARCLRCWAAVTHIQYVRDI